MNSLPSPLFFHISLCPSHAHPCTLSVCQLSASNYSCVLRWTRSKTISVVGSFSECTFVSAIVQTTLKLHSSFFPCVGLAATCGTYIVPSFKQVHLTTMACAQDQNGTSASPNSSEEVESHHGTPATKLSPFSPDQVLEDLKHINPGIVRPRVPPPFVLARGQSHYGPNGKAGNFIVPGSQDPFLSVPDLSSKTQSSGEGSKLSPSASTFTPTSLIESVSSNGTSCSSIFQYPLSTPDCGIDIQGPDFLSHVSRSNNPQYGSIGKKCLSSGPNDASIISPTSLPAGSFYGTSVAKLGSFKLGQFSTDVPKSRSFVAGPVSRTTSAKEIEKLLGVSFVNIRFLRDD